MEQASRIPNLLLQVFLFIATVAALFVVFVLYGKDLGNWSIPVALAISSIPMAINWLLKGQNPWRDDPNPARRIIFFVVLLVVCMVLAWR